MTLGLLSSGLAAEESPYSKVVVYLKGWNVLTRANLSAEQVRKTARKVLTITEPKRISTLVGLLSLGELKSRSPATVDARLVADFFKPDGQRVSYHASKFELVSEDQKLGHPIDEKFRHQFDEPDTW